MEARPGSTDVLLIGGGVASVRAARTLRREKFDGRILLVGSETMPPYNRPPLSKELLRDEVSDELVLAEAASWYERRGIELLTRTSVAALNLDSRQATLDDGSTVAFERCLLATGAEPIIPPIPGVEHALSLRTLADARRIRAAALAASSGRAVVVGGGFIGIEVASALAAIGLETTVVERADAFWAGSLGPELSAWATSQLHNASVEMRLGATVTGIEPGAVMIGAERLAADLVVIGVGVRPRTALATTAGLAQDDGIVTDAAHRTSHPAAWAAGDVARVDGRRIEHWHAAREGGERAAASMLDLSIPTPRAPWLFSEVAGTSLDVFGSASEWDEAQWVRPASVLAYVSEERIVQIAAIGGAIAPDAARALVERGAGTADLERHLSGA